VLRNGVDRTLPDLSETQNDQIHLSDNRRRIRRRSNSWGDSFDSSSPSHHPKLTLFSHEFLRKLASLG
jgi:hypothetical protein